jgi:hypothetical protein
MFENIGRAAEQMAANVGESRRGFLGRLGKGAAALAGALGGLSVFAQNAHATKLVRCTYRCGQGTITTFATNCSDCAPPFCSAVAVLLSCSHRRPKK